MHRGVWMVVVVVAIFVGIGFFLGRDNTPPAWFVSVIVGSVPIRAEIVATETARKQGLSGRTALPDGHGMLFIFETPDRYAFWMKDMRFPIDILWIGEGFTVVGITEDVLPESYPATFRPSVPVRYVLEVPAGFVRRNDIRTGDEISFPDGKGLN